jgi:O-antigen/teichoic acid export membrane protein
VNSVVQLALQRLDIVLITVLIGPAQAAIYTAATRFLVIGQFASTSIANAAQPRLAALLSLDDRSSTKAVYQATTAWIVLLTWPLYALCAVFADSILAIFGSGYGSGRTVTLILAGAMLVATACGMVDSLLNMAGRTSWTLANSVVALTLMVGLDLVLIPHLGILGAAIGWAAAIVANNVLPLIQLVLSLGLHPFGPATLRAAALSAGCFGVLPAAARLISGQTYAGALAAVAGLGVFLALSWTWRTRLGLPGLAMLRRTRTVEPADDAQIP